MAIKNDFVVKHGLTVTNTATINQDLIVAGSIKKNGVDVGYGYTGSQGNIGYTGSQGPQGIQGVAGYTGSQGVIGYTGSKGDSGLGFTIAKTYASVSALTADTNPTGIVAGQFALIETGNVENPENSRLYLWNGSAYSYVSDLSGAQGITGPQGVIGYSGSQGTTGYTGSQGTQGVTGYTGSQGNIGYTGSQGNIGYTGSAGPSDVLNATAASTSSVQYIIGVPSTGSNQTPNASTTVPVVFQPSTGNVGIGVSPPLAKFDLNGASASNIVAVAASDVDCSAGNYFTKTINGATTFTFSNVPASRAFSFVLAVTHTSGAITWPASVSWPNSTAPTLTTGKTHLFVFVTSDGGTTWRGNSSVNY